LIECGKVLKRAKEDGRMDVDAYCMKCKTSRKMKDAQEVTMENGRRAAKGSCPVCGTKMTKFLPSQKAAAK
jgi:ssDNA-binding Zn-finger/Zn-ribbon topoisomerase 1